MNYEEAYSKLNLEERMQIAQAAMFGEMNPLGGNQAASVLYNELLEQDPAARCEMAGQMIYEYTLSTVAENHADTKYADRFLL